MTKQLTMKFHGRVIEHLGLQLYQKTEAAIGEMIANAWDADAFEIQIVFERDANGVIVSIEVVDNGFGMTFQECEEKFLNIGYAKRGKKTVHKTPMGRTSLGRKGIGKLAGFGIAKTITVDTISESTGERTVFSLSIDNLLTEEYISSEKPFDVDEYEVPNEDRKTRKGTRIRLTNLVNPNAIDVEQLSLSIARRFCCTRPKKTLTSK